MITFFAVPKPFKGHIGKIQKNAINSWRYVAPDCQIILFGNEYGVEQFASEHNLIHVPNVKTNDYGTPQLDYVFEKAQAISNNNIMVYVNADIIFLKDLVNAMHKVPFNNFVLTGRRNDLDLDREISFEESSYNWITEYARCNSKMATPSGMDFFVFTRGSVGNIPPFTVGRKGWDNWFIYNARKNGLPVIDVSDFVFAIHQNHNYEHIQKRYGSNYDGPESDQNIALINGKRIYRWEIEDADWSLTPDSLEKKRLCMRELFRQAVLCTPTQLHFLFETVLTFRYIFVKKI